MAFNRAGSVGVETVMTQAHATPGGAVKGTVQLTGGSKARRIEAVNVALAARIEIEGRDREFATILPFLQQRIWGAFELPAGARHGLEFSIQLPWEAPITVAGQVQLRGMFVGVQTEVEIARATDKGDLDQIFIHPLPAQDNILAALAHLGFVFKGADLERGTLRGSTMPFYQEIEYGPSPEYARFMTELEVTFLSGPTGMDVVLEADNRGSLFAQGGDTYSRFRVDYATAGSINWQAEIRNQLAALAAKRGWR